MANETQEKQSIFSLDKIYVKDISLEIPNAPKIFLNREQPKIELKINFTNTKIDENVYQVVLRGVVDAKIANEQMFLIEVEQAGIFTLKNIEPALVEQIQNVECPSILFPYLRELVSDLTTRAGFLPVVLSPVNFAGLYQQQKNAMAQDTSKSIN
ncbi:MAG: protein-export chaperone SecB [Burkholderiales bacterium]|nr:protein-export chaperone SecB [Burkholderiales bacterium]